MRVNFNSVQLAVIGTFISVISFQACYAYAAGQLVTLQAKPEPIGIDLKKTALVVVDMQNAYASRGGIFDRLGQDLSGNKSVIENISKLVTSARSAGINIIFLKMKIMPELKDNDDNDSPRKHKGIVLANSTKKPKFKDRPMAQNPWNEEIVDELKPQSGDIVIEKRLYSGFVGTNLDKTLKTLKIKYLIFTGIAANSCVESTLRDAYGLDYWPILVADGINNAGPAYTQQATLWNVEVFFGWVTTTGNILRIMAENEL